MITTIDHFLHFQKTEHISQFLIYSLFVWGVMLPRSYCAALYYILAEASIDPVGNKSQKISTIKKVAFLLTLLAYTLSLILILNVSMLLGALSLLGAFLLTLLYLACIYQSYFNKKLQQFIPFAHHMEQMKLQSQRNLNPTLNIAYITVFNPPDLNIFEDRLNRIRNCFETSGEKFKIFAVIDGFGPYQNSNLAVEITKKYCDIVATGNFQRKRENLRWMINQSWDMGLINQLNQHSTIMHFIDDDTIPEDCNLVNRLTRNFSNPKIGGVTTRQLVYKPKYFWQHVMQIFESARNYSSQACLSLFGSVGCMPGRWYCVRGSLITKSFATQLATEKISLFGFFSRLRDPGDDRLITIQVQLNDYYTIMDHTAIVYTETPRKFRQLWGMVTRWARSSNIYTIQYTLRMFKKPNCICTLLLYWSNILLAFTTIYISIPYFIYKLLFGSRSIPLHYSLLIAFTGMFLTMCLRQLPLIIKKPRVIKYMSILGFVGIFMQFVQVYGMLTFLQSKWTGARTMGLGDKTNSFKIEKFA